MLNIVVLGPQGSGKGTQAQKIAATYGVAHFSTGDELRRLRTLETPFALKLREIMDSGRLVDDETMIEMIRQRLDRGDTTPGFVLDGFPRTMAQAEALDDLLVELRRPLDVVFEFRVPDRQQLVDRMLRRAAEEGRTDDTPEAIAQRLETYDRETAPLVEYYRTTRGNVVGIHADRSIGEVFHEISEALSSVEART